MQGGQAPNVAFAEGGSRNQQTRRRSISGFAVGLKQLEVWLPEPLIAKIDQLKNQGFQSRDAVLMSLIAGTIEETKPIRASDQLALL